MLPQIHSLRRSSREFVGTKREGESKLDSGIFSEVGSSVTDSSQELERKKSSEEERKELLLSNVDTLMQRLDHMQRKIQEATTIKQF